MTRHYYAAEYPYGVNATGDINYPTVYRFNNRQDRAEWVDADDAYNPKRSVILANSRWVRRIAREMALDNRGEYSDYSMWSDTDYGGYKLPHNAEIAL